MPNGISPGGYPPTGFYGTLESGPSVAPPPTNNFYNVWLRAGRPTGADMQSLFEKWQEDTGQQGWTPGAQGLPSPGQVGGPPGTPPPMEPPKMETYWVDETQTHRLVILTMPQINTVQWWIEGKNLEGQWVKIEGTGGIKTYKDTDELEKWKEIEKDQWERVFARGEKGQKSTWQETEEETDAEGKKWDVGYIKTFNPDTEQVTKVPTGKRTPVAPPKPEATSSYEEKDAKGNIWRVWYRIEDGKLVEVERKMTVPAEPTAEKVPPAPFQAETETWTDAEGNKWGWDYTLRWDPETKTTKKERIGNARIITPAPTKVPPTLAEKIKSGAVTKTYLPSPDGDWFTPIWVDPETGTQIPTGEPILTKVQYQKATGLYEEPTEYEEGILEELTGAYGDWGAPYYQKYQRDKWTGKYTPIGNPYTKPADIERKMVEAGYESGAGAARKAVEQQMYATLGPAGVDQFGEEKYRRGLIQQALSRWGTASLPERAKMIDDLIAAGVSIPGRPAYMTTMIAPGGQDVFAPGGEVIRGAPPVYGQRVAPYFPEEEMQRKTEMRGFPRWFPGRA